MNMGQVEIEPNENFDERFNDRLMQDIGDEGIIQPPLDPDLNEGLGMEENMRDNINYLGAPNIFRIQADDIQADENAPANLRQFH